MYMRIYNILEFSCIFASKTLYFSNIKNVFSKFLGRFQKNITSIYNFEKNLNNFNYQIRLLF